MLKNAYGFSSENQYDTFALPRYLTLGIAAIHNDYLLSFDSEYVFGNFSGLEEKEVQIWFLRAGLEKELNSWITARAGLVYPVIAETSTLGDIKADIPWPKIGGALGVGFRYKRFQIDLSLYGDAAKSYVEQTPMLSSNLSITMAF